MASHCIKTFIFESLWHPWEILFLQITLNRGGWRERALLEEDESTHLNIFDIPGYGGVKQFQNYFQKDYTGTLRWDLELGNSSEFKIFQAFIGHKILEQILKFSFPHLP